MRLFIILIFVTCSSIPHKPTAENIDLTEIINRVEQDEAIPQDKKNYIASELKNAQSGLKSQSRYIIELENKLAEKDKTIESQNKKIESLSESKGRIKQIDYQFWGLIGIGIMVLVGFFLFIILKFGNAVGKVANPAGIAIEAAKKAAGL